MKLLVGLLVLWAAAIAATEEQADVDVRAVAMFRAKLGRVYGQPTVGTESSLKLVKQANKHRHGKTFSCEHVAFGNRRFNKADLVVSAAKSPAACISWLKTNAAKYQAVEFNAATSTCRAVKLASASFTNTVYSRVGVIFVAKPNKKAAGKKLHWFNLFINHYKLGQKRRTKVSKTLTISIKNVPRSLKKHVHEIIFAALANKLPLRRAANKYYKTAQKAHKSLVQAFAAWWKPIKPHVQRVYKQVISQLKKQGKRIAASVTKTKVKRGTKHVGKKRLSGTRSQKKRKQAPTG